MRGAKTAETNGIRCVIFGVFFDTSRAPKLPKRGVSDVCCSVRFWTPVGRNWCLGFLGFRPTPKHIERAATGRARRNPFHHNNKSLALGRKT